MNAAIEVMAFLLGFAGWAMSGIVIPYRYWKISTIDGNVITASITYENLWLSCATDSTGVHNCREFPSMLGLAGLSTMIAVSWYAFNITQEFFDPLYPGTKFEIGEGLYIGWCSATLALIGGCCLLCACGNDNKKEKMSYPYQSQRRGTVYTTSIMSQQPNNYGRNAYV
ncbi:hypothetical protein AMELA_G00251190 [Ameiurus melas]|uniref:Claudin n=1 Tax=Ameiurus melas TaxID=219545 RepID=A0A7J5ZQI3_AMEME|nr:hypothetical protein AMELA_G00251190 [Ameiurus melas]